MKYYVLLITSGVDAEAIGPFDTPAARDSNAKEAARASDFHAEYDSIFRMNVGGDEPELYPFASGELGEDAETTVSRN
jgi:hypothetical protein